MDSENKYSQTPISNKIIESVLPTPLFSKSLKTLSKLASATHNELYPDLAKSFPINFLEAIKTLQTSNNVRLGEIAKIKKGYTPSTKLPELWNGNTPWLSISGMKNKYISKTLKSISESAVKRGSVIPSDTLLMSFKLTVGRLAITKQELVTNEAICAFQWNNPDVISTEYMYYALSGKDFSKLANQAVQGLTLNDETLSSIQVQLPPLPEQQKIAEFFTLLDERISKQSEKIAALKDLKKGYTQRIFNQELRFKDENGSEYPPASKQELSNLATVLHGYGFTPSLYVEGEYSVVTIANVRDKKYVDTKNSNTVNRLPQGIEPHQILRKGDILISLTGNCGRVSTVNTDNLLLNQRVGLLWLNEMGIKTLNREYLYQILSSGDFEIKMMLWGNGSAQKNILNKHVLKYNILVPSLSEQQKIADFLSIFDEKIEAEEKKLELLKEQKQGYMQRIFT